MFTETSSPIISTFATLDNTTSLWKDTLAGVPAKPQLMMSFWDGDNVNNSAINIGLGIQNNLSNLNIPNVETRRKNQSQEDIITGLSAQNIGANPQGQPTLSATVSGPDLIISSLSTPVSAITGNTLSFNYTIKNQGTTTAGSSTTQFYLSQDNTLDASDTSLGTSSVASINAGRSKNIAFSALLDSNLTPGTYYIFAKADTNNVVTEYDEANNISSKSISIAATANPDLTINSVTTGAVLTTSTALSINYNIGNIGGSSASSSVTKFYLSTDNTLDSSDLSLGTDGVGSISAGSSLNRSISLNLASFLTAGTYYLLTQADSGNTVTEGSESNNVGYTTFTVSTLADWCNQNLQDTDIKTLASSLTTDNNLSRNDMISLFRQTETDAVLSANELTDMRTLVSNGKQVFGMQDYVYFLSNSIANGNVANTTSGIGNLAVGSSGTQVESLVQKWFLGSDRPDTSYTYQYAQGSLFQTQAGDTNAISANDIKQGMVGDCYFLATLSSIAQEKPSYIQDMFIDNGDNTFTVKFLHNGVNEYVTVDRYLPTNSSSLIYASYGSNYTNTSNELWVALAEKAYAQLAELGWSRSTATNSYAAIEGGLMNTVIQQVTGLATTSKTLSATTSMTETQLINLVNSNQILTAGFAYGDGGGLVVNNHAYTITAYNSTTGKFHLRNPWGYQDSDLTWDQLKSLQTTIQYSNS